LGGFFVAVLFGSIMALPYNGGHSLQGNQP
jgi:hypothetical protein